MLRYVFRICFHVFLPLSIVTIIDVDMLPIFCEENQKICKIFQACRTINATTLADIETFAIRISIIFVSKLYLIFLHILSEDV